MKYKGQNNYTGVTYNGTYTSQITMIGIEDLGGGTKVDFNFESDINPSTQYNTGVATLNGIHTSATADTGINANVATTNNATSALAASTWGNGQVKVGIGSATAGYLAIGAVNNAGLDANQMTQPFGTAFGSGYSIGWSAVGGGYGAVSAKVRYDNSVRYLTPELGTPGLKGSYVYRPKQDQTKNNMFSSTTGLQGQSGVQELGLVYMNGPLNLIFVNQKDDTNGVKDILGTAQSAKQYTTNSFGGNYNIGATTIYGGYQTTKNDTGSKDNRTMRYGVKYALNGQTNLMAAYTSLYDNASSSTTYGQRSTTIGAGADYALSKLTNLYFRYEGVTDNTEKLTSTEYNGQNVTGTNTAATTTAPGFSSTSLDNIRRRTAIGVRMLF